jgi:hypothetical protein
MPRGYPSTGPSATATLPPDTTWVDQPKLDVLSSGYQAEDAVITPSDPRVVYEPGSLLTHTQIRGNTFPTGKVFLRRTDDGGATWHSLPHPDAAHLGMLQDNSSNLTFLVSPLDPHVVFLKITAGWYGATCTPVLIQKGDGWTACDPQYRSTDGGATWTPLLTPDYHTGHQANAGLMATQNGIQGGVSPVLRAQGSRLYSADQDRTAARMLASDDDGATWRTVDDALVAHDGQIQDYTITPTGSTIVAIAAPGSWAPPAPTSLRLWRSDDAGASWQRVAILPTPYDDGFAVAPIAGQAQPLLYLDAPHITSYWTDKLDNKQPTLSYTADDLRMSTDGGRTWQSAPTAGIPSAQRTSPGLLGVLADGSIVVGCLPPGTDPNGPIGQGMNRTITLFTWRAGASAWQQLGPNLDHGVDSFVITTTNGQQTLWVTTALPSRRVKLWPIVRSLISGSTMS